MQKIMIVDDDPQIKELLVCVLSDEGYQPVPAGGNSRIAKEIVREQPDLILLDLMMPELDGWQVLELLQNMPSLADVPVIVFTAAISSLADIQEFYGPAVSDYVPKPFDIDDLLARIRSHLPSPLPATGDDRAVAAAG